MMTLKHIAIDGREKVVSLTSVDYDSNAKILVAHGTPDGDLKWKQGRAFLMNASGKTVATYILNK